MLVESHICLLEKITNTTIFTDKKLLQELIPKATFFFVYF